MLTSDRRERVKAKQAWRTCSVRDRVATIDMRVDYLRPADLADLIAIGEVKLLGNRVGNATAQVFSAAKPDVVIAEGRGVYNIRKAGTRGPDNVCTPVRPRPNAEEVP